MVPMTLEREQKKTVPVTTPVITPVTKGYDKRYFPRWEANKRVEYHNGEGVAFLSYTKDLSLDGTSIFVFGDLPSWDRVQLRVHLAGKDSFEARGRVAWSKPEATYKLLGIAFEGLGPEAQELITRHAFEIREDHLLVYRLNNSLILKGRFSSKRSLRSHQVPPLRPQQVPAGWQREGPLRDMHQRIAESVL